MDGIHRPKPIWLILAAILTAAPGLSTEAQPTALRELELDADSGYGAHFSRDGSKLLTVGSWEAKVWDTKTWTQLGRGLHHGDEAELARNKAWRPQVGDSIVHPNALSMAAFDAAGQRVMTVGHGEALVWDLATGKPVGPAITHLAKPVWNAALSPDGRLVATWHHDDTMVHLWYAANGARLHTYEHEAPILDVQFDWEGRTLATTEQLAYEGDRRFIEPGRYSLHVTREYGGVTILWDVLTGWKRHTLPHDHDVLPSVDIRPALSANGCIAVAMSGGFEVYEIATGKRLASVDGPSSRYIQNSSLVISADGCFVAYDAQLDSGIWDIRSGEMANLNFFLVADDVAFDPTDCIISTGPRVIAQAGLEVKAGFWNLTMGKRIHPFGRYWGRAVFSPDGRMLVLASYGKTKIIFARPGKTGAARW